MKIAVCEDNAADQALVCDYITRYCAEHCFVCELYRFGSGEALLEVFAPGVFDILFLDIYMGGVTGMEVARKIRERDTDCALVFITVSEDHLRESFSVYVTSYVVKPIRPEEMAAALTACRRVFQRSARCIEVMSERQAVKIPLVRIRFVEVLDKVTWFHTGQGAVKTYLPIDEAERALGGGPFLRCHRAFIVNMNHIAAVEERDFLMRDGARVPMRKNGGKELRAAVSAYSTSRLFAV